MTLKINVIVSFAKVHNIIQTSKYFFIFFVCNDSDAGNK